MAAAADTFEVRGLCKVIGSLGGLYWWNEDSRRDVEDHLFVHLRQEDKIRLAELIGHPELLHTEQAHGKVDTAKLITLCTSERTPLQLLQCCNQLLHERIGAVGTKALLPSNYHKHIDERDAQLVRVIGHLERRVRKLERQR